MRNEDIYLNLLRDVYENGIDRPDRTGIGIRGVFGRQTRYDLSSFPLLTTKKMELKSIVSELLWFIEGSGDERRLAEIRYGKPREDLIEKKTIWTQNAQAPYWKDKAKFDGDLGEVYGVQFRRWRSVVDGSDGNEIVEVDQVANLIDGIKNNPFDRRHIITAWNPGALNHMALPPCHVMSQYYVDGGKLSCMLTQRSNDLFLGSPYNIASYAIFTSMIAQVTGYRPGELIYSQGDVHIYHNHFDAVKEQLSRKPKALPFLYIDPSIRNIDDFRLDSFEVMGYDPHDPIKAEMAV